MKKKNKKLFKRPFVTSQKKRIHCVLSPEVDLALLQWAAKKKILNDWGTPNRSGALEHLIRTKIM